MRTSSGCNLLPAQPDLHVVRRLPERQPRAHVVFVHGAYVDNWCWEPYFLPWFAQRGFAAHALSLRGHGKSGGLGTLFVTSLDDYANDVTSVVASLPEPPVLVGHSMGAAIVERVIESTYVTAAVLLAPVPPGGLLQVMRDLIASDPDILLDFQQLESGHPTPAALEALRPLYFTDAIPSALMWEALMHTQPESQRALLDLTFRMELPWRRRKPPVLVVAPGADRLFPPARVGETAARHRTQPVVLPGLPHMLMLDDGWEAAALAIAGWIERTLAV